MVSRRACSVSAVPPAGVRDAWTPSIVSPAALTIPQAILVPPMSKPIAFGTGDVVVLGCDVPLIASARMTDGCVRC